MKLGIISDIHEDVFNLEKALTGLEQHNCDRVVCLGDIVGFSYPSFGFFDTRDGARCIDMVKSNCQLAVAGNHDLFPVRRIPMNNAGFNYPPYWYQLDYQERKKLAGEEVWLNEENEFDPLLGSDQRDFLKKLPEYATADFEGHRFLFSHYLFPDLTGSSKQHYIQFGPVEPHLEFMDQHLCSIGFSGHQHVEGVKIFSEAGVDIHGFGRVKLGDRLTWIVGPCVANGKHDNGFMIFNTESYELEVIPLGSPKRIMQTVYI